MLQQYDNCGAVLQAQLLQRQQRNPAYSLRAFARDLELSPSRLSEVMGGGAGGMSATTAEKVAVHLGWNPGDRQYFIDLAVLDTSKCVLRRQLAESRVAAYRAREAYHALAEKDFDFINDWYHLAIVELAQLNDFEPSAGWIARKLALTEAQTVNALANLEKVGLIRFDDDRLQVVQSRNAVATSPSSASIRAFHRQMLAKADAAIDEQEASDRDLAAIIVAVDRSQNPRIRELLKTLRREFIKDAKALSERKDALYGLCIQWFRLSQD